MGVIVKVNDIEYAVDDNYAYTLHYKKVCGWELWYEWDGKEKLIGGQFNFDKFEIVIDGKVIYSNK